MKYQVLKGMLDILPKDVWKWQFIESQCRKVFHRFNFQEIRTPVLESLSLFRRSIGEETDIIQKEMFQFKDRGDRDIVLRPEVTASVVRAFIENQLKEGKLYYIGPSFRAERPQAGRYRQFHQIGAEFIGGVNPQDDVFLITVQESLLKALGFQNFTLMLNSVGCGNDDCRKKYRTQLQEYLIKEQKHLCENCRRRTETNVIRVMDCKQSGCQGTIQKAPTILEHICGDCRKHFEEVQALLKGKSINFEVNSRIVRGLDYYNRTVFEVTHPALGAQNAIGAGGRYDELVGQLGGPKNTGASGFAFGIERMLIALEREEAFETEEIVQLCRSSLIYICVLGTDLELRKEAIRFQDLLRNEDYRVEEIQLDSKPLKKQLQAAHRIGANVALIFGEDEFKNQKVMIKDMIAGTQEQISIDGIINYLKGKVVSL